jgi:hypothetical protein
VGPLLQATRTVINRLGGIETVERIDLLFAIERDINGKTPLEASACETSAVGCSSACISPA